MNNKRRTAFIWLLGALVLAYGFWADMENDWTARSSFTSPLAAEERVERQKTIWDWLDLLLIPAVLAAGGLLFNAAERRNESRIANERAERERKLADERAERERQLAVERAEIDRKLAEERAEKDRQLADETAQEAVLQAYLEQMSVLLIDKGLRQSGENDEVRDVARAWTLTVLRRVRDHRKTMVLRFLFESYLVDRDNYVIHLADADLGGADLSAATIISINLHRANLSEANLSEVVFAYANFSSADLSRANLTKAKLIEADLREAKLLQADLRGADLGEADLHRANLFVADLREANLSEANLSSADLRGSIYNHNTKWPDGFDPEAAGAILDSAGV